MDIDELRSRRTDLIDSNDAILAKASSDKRDLTEEEGATFDRNLSEVERTERNIERLGLQAEKSRPNGRKTEADEPEKNLSVEQPNERPKPKTRIERGDDASSKNGGFKTLGEMAIAIRLAGRPGGGEIDPRLARLAPTTYANEGSGAEGGFAVPQDYRAAIMEKVLGEDSLLSRTDQVPTGGNTLTVPKDNGTPWGTTGIRAYWGNEGGQKTQSRPAFDTMSLRLNKVYALVPVTDELAEDAPALDSYIRRRAPEAIDFAINLAIVQGTGTTQPLGILNSPATVSVAKEGSQLADTIVANNINKMWSRMYAPHRRNAVWLINQSIETELDTLSMPGRDNTGAAVTTWGTHVYIPPGGISGSPYGTLKGRPVIPTQATNELGDKGDIILCDLKAYLTAIRSGANPKVDVSIHLWFDYDVTAYRFVLRMTGQPWWDLPITPRDGSNTLSPFVTLDERG